MLALQKKCRALEEELADFKAENALLRARIEELEAERDDWPDDSVNQTVQVMLDCGDLTMDKEVQP